MGVLAADLSLGVGDYRASERTFQLLTQAVGRAGRGELAGEAVIQTYQPEHYAVTYAAAQDYPGFYGEEILFRELMGYPPASHMMAVQVFARDETRGAGLASHLAKLAGDAATDTLSIQILGPAPGSIGRVNDIFRFVFYVKSKEYDTLIGIKDFLEEKIPSWQLSGESVQFDFDPMNTL